MPDTSFQFPIALRPVELSSADDETSFPSLSDARPAGAWLSDALDVMSDSAAHECPAIARLILASPAGPPLHRVLRAWDPDSDPAELMTRENRLGWWLRVAARAIFAIVTECRVSISFRYPYLDDLRVVLWIKLIENSGLPLEGPISDGELFQLMGLVAAAVDGRLEVEDLIGLGVAPLAGESAKRARELVAMKMQHLDGYANTSMAAR